MSAARILAASQKLRTLAGAAQIAPWAESTIEPGALVSTAGPATEMDRTLYGAAVVAEGMEDADLDYLLAVSPALGLALADLLELAAAHANLGKYTGVFSEAALVRVARAIESAGAE